MRDTFRSIAKLACEDTAFAAMVLVTVLFALIFQLVVAPSPELTTGLIALFVSTAVLECWESAAARRRSHLHSVPSRPNSPL